MGDTLLDRLSTYPALHRMRAGALALFDARGPPVDKTSFRPGFMENETRGGTLVDC
jgi:hypothetical protein